MSYFAVWASLAVANYLHAEFKRESPEGAFMVAFERSWFQGVAVLALWLLHSLWPYWRAML